MQSDQSTAQRLEVCFQQIEQNQMQGIPILNPAIRVQAVGFTDWQGRQLGVMITPWFMSLLMLPSPDEDWQGATQGGTQCHVLPEKKFEFTNNDFDGIGPCQTHALHSPMFKFESHEDALAEAERVLAAMMQESEPGEMDKEAERLRRFLDGDESALLQKDEEEAAEEEMVEQTMEKKAKALSRRDLLLGGA